MPFKFLKDLSSLFTVQFFLFVCFSPRVDAEKPIWYMPSSHTFILKNYESTCGTNYGTDGKT